MKDRWLIWSREHEAWWRPASQGYTQDRGDAGFYTFDDALQIVRAANRFSTNKPNEALVPYDEAWTK